MAVTKAFRQGQIRRILERTEVLGHEQLREELKRGQPSIMVSQATVSRDLDDLGATYDPRDGYKLAPTVQSVREIGHVIAEFLLDVRTAQNLVVLKTGPGNAGTIAVAIDKEPWSEIVGTVSGDDTVLIVTETNQAAAALAERVLQYVEGR
jgi:transcriptional regulator of arginine metabolism